MKAAFAFLVAGLGLLAPAAALAHHSFAAEYDAKKPVTLKGTVTKVEWTNPHARFYVDVKDESGNVTNVGDQVTVEGAQAKDGSQMANARSVVLADGKKVFSGAAGDAIPNQ